MERMRRFRLLLTTLTLLAAGLAFASPARAQFTTVTAQVKDSNGSLYSNCVGNVSFVPAPSATTVPLIQGSTFSTTVVIASCDSNGNFSVVLVDNNQVSDGHSVPPASQWQFNICTAVNAFPIQYCFQAPLTITGATQNITAALTAVAPLLPPSGGGGGGDTTATYVLATPALPSLPNSRVLTAGVNTTIDTSTPGQIKINAAGSNDLMSNGSNCFARYGGNDVNTGTSWEFGKATIMACYDQLPAEGGTVYFADGGGESTPVASNAVTGAGIWIMGPSDPNYASPPSGWRQLKKVSFIGQQGSASLTHITAGSQVDNDHPAIWLSGTSDSLYFANIDYKYPNVGTRIGCTSLGDCSDPDGGVSGVTFYNVNGHINQVAGAGPNVRIGSNSFWNLFLYSAFSGNSAEQVPIATLARASGVTTVTTSSPFTVIQYQHLGIVNSTDGSFNGSYQVASVTNSTHFTIVNAGPDVSATDFDGTVITDKQIPIVEDPWNGNTQGTGSGQIYVEHQQGGSQYSMGGVRMWPGTNGSGIYVSSINPEGDFEHAVAPGVWVVINSAPAFVHASNIEMSDCVGGCVAGRTDLYPGVNSSVVSNEVVVDRVQTWSGPATALGSYLDPLTTIKTPLSEGQSGFFSGVASGQTDAGRRMFSPSALPHGKVNIANTDSTTWTNSGGSITTGVLAPDGTLNAAQISGAGQMIISGGNITPATGDSFVFGVWLKSVTNNGYDGTAVTFQTNANGFGAGNICQSSSDPQVALRQRLVGDGQWDYFSGICVLSPYGGNFAGLQITVTSNSTHTIRAYAPAILWFTSADNVSVNEANEIANTLSFAPTNCPTGGYVCMMPQQRFAFGGTTQFFGLFSHANTANRTYTWPDYPISVAGFDHTQTWSATQTFSQLNLTEGSAPSGASSTDILYALSSIHWPAFNANNGTPRSVCGSTGTFTSGHIVAANSSGTLCDLVDGGTGTGSGSVTSVTVENITTGTQNFATANTTNPGTTPDTTLTLANAPARKIFMNNTSGAAAPDYQSLNEASMPGTTVFTDTANTFGAHLNDFSAATIKVPSAAAGVASSANNITIDSSTGYLHGYQNGNDRLFGMATNVGTSGQVCTSNANGTCTYSAPASGVTIQSNTVNNTTQTTLNFTNTTGASGINFTNPSGGVESAAIANTTGGGNAVATMTATGPQPGDYVGYNGSSSVVNITPGVVPNAQSGTSYTILTGDRGKSLFMSNGSSIAVTLPQAGTTGFASNFYFCIRASGAGTVTVTPTTSTINGASSLAISTTRSACVYSDNTNYLAITIAGF